MGAALLSAADGFVIAMLTVMAVSLGIVAVLVACIRRSASRRDREVEELLEELAAKEQRQTPAGPETPPPAEPWEREADWWKK